MPIPAKLRRTVRQVECYNCRIYIAALLALNEHMPGCRNGSRGAAARAALILTESQEAVDRGDHVRAAHEPQRLAALEGSMRGTCDGVAYPALIR